jgi:hypothetical protein
MKFSNRYLGVGDHPNSENHECGEVIHFSSGYITVEFPIQKLTQYFGAEELEEISEDEYGSYLLIES